MSDVAPEARSELSKVRLALPDDSERMAEIFRACFRQDLLPYTILGAPGLENYLRDLITLQPRGGSSLFLVYEQDGTAVGVAEFRRLPSAIFLNHIYVLSSLRGQGVGKALLLAGIEATRDLEQQDFALDVFADNHPARSWYESLGLGFASEHLWIQLSLPLGAQSDNHWWTLLDLPQADRVQAAYGFSQFRLQTRSGTYSVGRIGDSLFRTTDVELLDDVAALAALSHLDDRRDLLLVCEPDEWVEKAEQPGAILAQSHRLTGTTAGVLSRLMESTATPGERVE